MQNEALGSRKRDEGFVVNIGTRIAFCSTREISKRVARGTRRGGAMPADDRMQEAPVVSIISCHSTETTGVVA